MNLTEPNGIVQAQQRQTWAEAVATQFTAFARDAEKQYAEGYRAGRIAALREVGCCHADEGFAPCAEIEVNEPEFWCKPCRLLAEAESGEDTGEVGDDR